MLNAVREWFTEYFNLPWLNLPNIGITEVVDILIVTVFVYLILKWIRKTRAWSLFKGILTLVAVFALSNAFGLNTVYWVVQTVFEMGFITVVILLQPELRKALEQIGRGSFLSPSFLRGGEQSRVTLRTANEIVKAAFEMAKVKTGALMVIEQNYNLGEYERTGIPVDAVVSSQLLINIFEKNTPLHDGAVIMRQNRIVAAACILPLTDEDVSSDLGTRHRASIGMSEASDAVVVVVSEETGAVSLAFGGKLSRDLTDNQLRELLLMNDHESNHFRRYSAPRAVPFC